MMRGELWRWVARGAGLAVGVLFIVAVATVLQASTGILVLVLISVLLAAALDPIVDWVRRRSRFSRAGTVLGVYVIFTILVALLLLLVVPAAIDELTELSERAPALLADIRTTVQGLEPEVLRTALTRMIEAAEKALASGPTDAVPDPEVIVQAGLTAAEALISVITVLSLTFFWLIGRETMQRFAMALLPADQRAGVRDAWNIAEARLGLWVRGQLTLMVAIGLVTTIAYFILGLENALVLGVIAGIAEVIPIVGPAIGAIPALISATISGGPELALLVAVVYVVIQTVEGNILVPMVMKNAVGLPPFLVIVALLVGAAVAGLTGALLSIPVTAVIVVILERVQARDEPVALHSIEGQTAGAEAPDGESPDAGADAAHGPVPAADTAPR
jgi:predicted PurR-regulated permease PerM